MNFKVTLISAAIVLAGCSGQVMAKDWKTVTIVTEGAYAPWNLTNSDGSLGGFEPELMKAVCERAKLECKFVTGDWDG